MHLASLSALVPDIRFFATSCLMIWLTCVRDNSSVNTSYCAGSTLVRKLPLINYSKVLGGLVTMASFARFGRTTAIIGAAWGRCALR